MISFFDVFKWDRFVSTSIIELLFWLLSAMSVLLGAYGLFEGLQFLASNPIVGLMLITLSVIGGLTGVVAARVLCEAVVIMFRMNDNLIDIRESGLNGAAQAVPVPESIPDEQQDLERAMLERKLAESRQQAARRIEARNTEQRQIEPQIEPRALAARIPEAPAMEPRNEVRYAEPRVPEGRVPRSWDVRAPEPRRAPESQKAPDVHAWESRGAEGGSQERTREPRAPEIRSQEPRASERSTTVIKTQEPKAADLRSGAEFRERSTYSPIEPRRLEPTRTSELAAAEVRVTSRPLLRPTAAEPAPSKLATLDVVPEPVVVEPDPQLKADALAVDAVTPEMEQGTPIASAAPVTVEAVPPSVAIDLAFELQQVVASVPMRAAEVTSVAASEPVPAPKDAAATVPGPTPKPGPRAPGKGSRGKSNSRAKKNAAAEPAKTAEPAAAPDQSKTGDAA